MKTLQLQKPHMLVVVGLPGSGKSFFATQFSDMFHAPYIDYARYLRVVDNQDSALDLAYDALLQILKTQKTLVIEGIGATSDDRLDIKRLARKHDYEILYVWVQTDPRTAEQRSVHSKTASISSREFADRADKFAILTKAEKSVVISGKHTFATQAKVVLKKLVTERPEAPLGGSSRPIQPRGRITIG